MNEPLLAFVRGDRQRQNEAAVAQRLPGCLCRGRKRGTP